MPIYNCEGRCIAVFHAYPTTVVRHDFNGCLLTQRHATLLFSGDTAAHYSLRAAKPKHTQPHAATFLPQAVRASACAYL